MTEPIKRYLAVDIAEAIQLFKLASQVEFVRADAHDAAVRGLVGERRATQEALEGTIIDRDALREQVGSYECQNHASGEAAHCPGCCREQRHELERERMDAVNKVYDQLNEREAFHASLANDAERLRGEQRDKIIALESTLAHVRGAATELLTFVTNKYPNDWQPDGTYKFLCPHHIKLAELVQFHKTAAPTTTGVKE